LATNQGDLVRHLSRARAIVLPWRQISRLAALLILAVLILAPIALVATRGATLSGLYEESIGYRYFYSLRTVQGERAALFLPQGQIQDLLCQAIQVGLTLAGYQPYDTAGRIDAFSYCLVACAMLLALVAFWFGNAEQGEGSIAYLFAATLWGSVFYLPGYNTVYALLQPDYLPFILAIAISTHALIARLALLATLSPVRDAILFGLLLGICLATKLTLAVFAATAMVVYLMERPHRRGLLVLAGASLIGIGIWLAAIKLDYRGSGAKLSDYYAYFLNFTQASAGVLKQDRRLFGWALGKLNPGSYLHGALVTLPILVATVFLSCRRARRAVLAAIFAASLAYGYVLYNRDYPGTNLEIAVFVCLAFLCLWREMSRSFSEGVAKRVTAGASMAVILFFLIVDIGFFRSTVLSIVRSVVANTAQQERLREAISTLPKPMLWLVPTNNDRMLTVHSAIMKGGDSVDSRGRRVVSKTMRAISPDLDLVPGTSLTHVYRHIEEYRTFIFATASPMDKPSILAMQSTYNIELRRLSCGQFAEMPGYRMIACKR